MDYCIYTEYTIKLERTAAGGLFFVFWGRGPNLFMLVMDRYFPLSPILLVAIPSLSLSLRLGV